MALCAVPGPGGHFIVRYLLLQEAPAESAGSADPVRCRPDRHATGILAAVLHHPDRRWWRPGWWVSACTRAEVVTAA